VLDKWEIAEMVRHMGMEHKALKYEFCAEIAFEDAAEGTT
jgi:hypothetical protein